MKYFYDTRRDSYRFAEEPINFFINVGLQVTRRCNMKCVYCSEAESMPDASLEEIKRMVDRLVDNGLRRMCITGGEPLLRDDLEEILKYIKGKSVNVTLSTNGACVTEELLHRLIPYIDNIRFSLRGLKKVHDEITSVKGSFDKTIEAIRLSKRLGLPVSVVVTVVSQNYELMGNIAVLCEEMGVDKLYFFSLIPRGRATKIYDRDNVSIDRLTREYNKVVEMAKNKKLNIDIKVANFTIEGECVLIFPNGDMVSVPSFTDEANQKVIGNILRDDPHELWERYPFKENYIDYYRNH